MANSKQLKELVHMIDQSYQQEQDARKALLLAKIAVIEISGWTEEYIDNLLKTYIDSKNPVCKKELNKKIQKTNGFHYSDNFRNIWVQILGNILFEKIVDKIPLECQQLESALNNLKTSRDKCAHTNILTMGAIDAPQRSLSYINKIGIGLMKFMRELKKLGL